MPKDQKPKTVPARAAPGDGKATASRSIVVKFRENIVLPYEDEIEKYFPSVKITGWDALSKLATGCSFRRVLRALTPENAKALFDVAYKSNPKLKITSAGLFHHHVIEAVPASVAEQVRQELRSWPEVEYAYFPPTAFKPPTNGAPAIPQPQHYLKSAKLGIDVEYALRLPGGDGAGQRVVDVEVGWELNHTGLRASQVQQVGLLNDPLDVSHGTAVLGILCGNNKCGVLGAAHNLAAAFVVGHDGLQGVSIHRAVELAILSLMQGIDPARLDEDGYLMRLVNAATLPQVQGGPVLLLEIQVNHPTMPGTMMPVEIDPFVADFIEWATAIGIVVVEAAGNGGQDLDAYPDQCRNFPDRILNPNVPAEFRDTGAIMVGAGNRPVRLNGAPTPWERDGVSNFGHRVNCFAWGNSVVTLDSTTADPRGATQSNFGGTSSAAAIVAGAAIVVQGLAFALRGRYCSPPEVRKFLGDATPGLLANTPTEKPGTDLIGVMPNLQHIAINCLGIAPPAPAAPTGLHVVGAGGGGAGGGGGA